MSALLCTCEAPAGSMFQPNCVPYALCPLQSTRSRALPLQITIVSGVTSHNLLFDAPRPVGVACLQI